MKSAEEVAGHIFTMAISWRDGRPWNEKLLVQTLTAYADEKLEEAAKIAEEIPDRTVYLGVDTVTARILQAQLIAKEIRALKSTPGGAA